MITKGQKVAVNPNNYSTLFPKQKPVENIESYRKDALTAATGGLCYPDSVITALNNAVTVGEIQRIMRRARQAM